MAKPRKPKLGQHFLADTHIRRCIVDALHLTREHTVIEIGAGAGAVTGLLAERAGRVVAVEMDPGLAAGLRQKFTGEPRVEVVEGDILKLPLADFARGDPPPRATIFGNLPYYITSPILLRLFAHAHKFEEIVVMVQKEVGERLTASPGSRDYGLLTVTTLFYTEPKLLFLVRPGAFRPPPKVDSALVRLTPRRRPAPCEDEKGFFRLLRLSFARKRKTLVNNLKGLYPAGPLKAALEKAEIPAQARAEEVSLEQFTALYSALSALTP